MDTDDASGESNPKGFVVPWGWLSLSLSVISIAALGTLAVVAKKESADALSTIALALAILSFAAQLIIVLAQAYNGMLQVSQAGRVNADTRSSLAEIRATSNALLATQREQFSKVLQAALGAAVPAAVKDIIPESNGEDADQAETERTSRDLEERLYVRLNEALSAPRSAPEPSIPMAREASPLYERITTFPDKERGMELKSILDSLSPEEAAIFSRNATIIRDRAQRGDPNPSITVRRTPGRERTTTRLIDLGLITTREMPRAHDGSSGYRTGLSTLGAEVASLFLGRGEMPQWLRNPD